MHLLAGKGNRERRAEQQLHRARQIHLAAQAAFRFVGVVGRAGDGGVEQGGPNRLRIDGFALLLLQTEQQCAQTSHHRSGHAGALEAHGLLVGGLGSKNLAARGHQPLQGVIATPIAELIGLTIGFEGPHREHPRQGGGHAPPFPFVVAGGGDDQDVVIQALAQRLQQDLFPFAGLGGAAGGAVNDAGPQLQSQLKRSGEVQLRDELLVVTRGVDRNIDHPTARSQARSGRVFLADDGAGDVAGMVVTADATEQGFRECGQLGLRFLLLVEAVVGLNGLELEVSPPGHGCRGWMPVGEHLGDLRPGKAREGVIRIAIEDHDGDGWIAQGLVAQGHQPGKTIIQIVGVQCGGAG